MYLSIYFYHYYAVVSKCAGATFSGNELRIENSTHIGKRRSKPSLPFVLHNIVKPFEVVVMIHSQAPLESHLVEYFMENS